MEVVARGIFLKASAHVAVPTPEEDAAVDEPAQEEERDNPRKASDENVVQT